MMLHIYVGQRCKSLLDLPDKFDCVYVREDNLKLYYSADFDPVCIYCAAEAAEDTQKIVIL